MRSGKFELIRILQLLCDTPLAGHLRCTYLQSHHLFTAQAAVSTPCSCVKHAIPRRVIMDLHRVQNSSTDVTLKGLAQEDYTLHRSFLACKYLQHPSIVDTYHRCSENRDPRRLMFVRSKCFSPCSSTAVSLRQPNAVYKKISSARLDQRDDFF